MYQSQAILWQNIRLFQQITYISLFINNIYKNEDLKQKYKIVVIDPHASLEKDIGGRGKVIDFNSKEDTINLFTNSNDYRRQNRFNSR